MDPLTVAPTSAMTSSLLCSIAMAGLASAAVANVMSDAECAIHGNESSELVEYIHHDVCQS